MVKVSRSQTIHSQLNDGVASDSKYKYEEVVSYDFISNPKKITE